MRKATEILPKVKELLASGIPVYVTDGTLYKIVTDVEYEFDKRKLRGCLAVRYETDGRQHFVELETDLFDKLTSWALRKYGGGWFFAPLWWHLL